MLPMMTVAVAPNTNSSPWMASLYAGLFTAVVGLILVLVTGMPVIPAIVGLLIGAAPVLAYQFAIGTFGNNWRPVIAGIIGFILFVVGFFFSEAFGWIAPILALLSMLIWPIVVGAMTAGQSVGKLFLASLLGLVLAVVVFFVVGTILGEDPNAWVGLASILALSFWGGTVGAALYAGAR